MSTNHAADSGSPDQRGLTGVLSETYRVVLADPFLLFLFFVPALAAVLTQSAVLLYQNQLTSILSQLLPGLFAQRLAFMPTAPYISVGLVALCVLTFVVFGTAVQTAVLRADASLQRHPRPSYSPFPNGGRTLLRVLGYLIGSVLAIAFGAIFLVLPGIYVLTRLAVGLPAIVLDDRTVVEAAQDSWGRTNSHTLQIAGILLILAFIWLLLSAVPLLGVPIAIATVSTFGVVATVVMYCSFDR